MSNPSLTATDFANSQGTTTYDGVTTTPETNLTEIGAEAENIPSTVDKGTEKGPIDPQPGDVKPAEKDKASSRFAALARKEKDVRSKLAAAEERERQLVEREARIQAEERRFEEARKKRRPMDALKELGYTYQDVTQDVLGGYEEPKLDPVDEKLNPVKEQVTKAAKENEDLRKELQALRDEREQEKRQREYDRGMNAIRDTVKDAEKFELVNTMGEEAVEMIRDTVVEYWKTHKEELSLEEAAEMVEKFYEEQYLAKLTKTKKLQSRVPQAASTPSAPKEVREPAPSLSNSLTTAAKQPVDVDSMSKSEAIAYLSKQLKFTE